MNKRPYTKPATDWTEEVLREWAEQVKTRPRESVLVTPGGSLPDNLYKGGTEPRDGPNKRGIEARGRDYHRISNGAEPRGYFVKGLTGRAAVADRVVLRIAGVDARCAWALRAEFGLVPDIAGDTKAKAAHLGAYLDGRVWPASAYMDRLARGKQMFAVGYMCAI